MPAKLSLLDKYGQEFYLNATADEHCDPDGNPHGYDDFAADMEMEPRPKDVDLTKKYGGVSSMTIGNWRRRYDNDKSKEKK